jgi:hypothetical protein
VRASRSLLLAALLTALSVTSAAAEPPAVPTVSGEAQPLPPMAPEGDAAGRTLKPAQMTERKVPERLVNRPSGFWTSNRPAQGGAYKYGKLAVGTGLAILTGLFMLRLIRRASKAPRPAWPTTHK